MAVSKKTLKEYEFRNMSQYFDYITESHLNGQLSQVRELYNKLSRKQKADCVEYLKGGTVSEELCRDYLIRATFKVKI